MTGDTAPLMLFPTCLVETMRPSVASAVSRLLQRRGYRVEIARGVTCCGQPAWNAGFGADAGRVARRTVRALARTSGTIVVPSGSCTVMIRDHWPTVFAGTRDERAAREVSLRVHEFSGFVKEGECPAPASAEGVAGQAVVYHDSCHMLRGLGERESPRSLLDAAGIAVEAIPGAERCCGFGGTFSVKLPEVSVAMADEKLDEVVSCGVRRVVGCDVSCLLHLSGRASRRGLDLEFSHLAEILDREIDT